MYLKDCMVVLVLYDVNDRDTFEKARHSVVEATQHTPQGALVLLIGTKGKSFALTCSVDVGSRAVTFGDGLDYAKEQGCFFSEVSCKTGSEILVSHPRPEL